MLIKSRKGQILKKINLEKSFVDSSRDKRFYIPIELSTINADFFNVKNLIVSFTPTTFTDSIVKPYHLKPELENKNAYNSNDIIDKKNSDIFKGIYSKNIVSTKDQSIFERNIFSVNIPFSEGDIFEVVTSTVMQDIVDVTKTTKEEGVEEFDDFYIRVYALNEKSEVVDSIETKSQNILSYLNTTTELTQKRKLNILSSKLNDALDSFEISFKKFIFSNTSTSSNLVITENTGTEIVVGEQLVQDIVNSSDSEDFLVDLNFYMVDSLESDSSLELDLISIGTSSISTFVGNDSLIDVLKRNFNLNCLTNQNYKNMVFKLYNKIIDDNLEVVSAYYKVVFSASSVTSSNVEVEDLVIMREATFSAESIIQAFNDIQRFNFSNDVKNKRVVFAEIKSSIDGISTLNKISLSFSSSLHSQEKIFKNSIGFEFVVKNQENNETTLQTLEEFYFDKNLTLGNSIVINANNKIENYADGDDTIDLYFSLDDDLSIDEVFIKFYNNFTNSLIFETITIGPLNVDKSSNAPSFNLSQNKTNVFILTGNNVKDKMSSIPIDSRFLANLVAGRPSSQKIFFDVVDFVKSNLVNIQKLGFFNVEKDNSLITTLSSEEAISEVLGSILVKIEKRMLVNNENIFTSNYYGFLSDIPSYENENKERFYDISDYNNVSNLVNLRSFDENSQVRNDLIAIRDRNFNSLSNNFDCVYATTIEPIVLNKKVVSSLGSPSYKSSPEIDESKEKLVEMIIELNQSYNIFKLSNLINLAYSTAFVSNRQDFVRKLYDITNISNNDGKILERVRIVKEDLM